MTSGENAYDGYEVCGTEDVITGTMNPANGIYSVDEGVDSLMMPVHREHFCQANSGASSRIHSSLVSFRGSIK